MALVIREARQLEARVEHELAGQCGTWQQLRIMKERHGKQEEQPATCEGLTRSQRLLWYRNNQPAVQLDNERCALASNYRQLQLSRGVRAVQETLEERAERDSTRSEALAWYRGGGKEHREREAEILSNCGTWQQYYLATRGRAEPRDADQEVTRSERLHWYRYGGGKEMVEERSQLCRDSANWVQYQLTRDTRQHREDLTDSINRHWSDFRNKQQLSDHLTHLRMESLQEREEVRAHVRRQAESRASVAKECWEAHQQPFEGEKLAEEQTKKQVAELTAEERIEALRRTTEEMLTSRTEYVESTRALAQRAIREDAAACAASRLVRRTTVIQEGA